MASTDLSLDADPISLPPLQDRAEAALSAAKAAGADAADAVASASLERSVTVRNGKNEDVESAESVGLMLRVFVGARSAMVGVSPRGYLAAAAQRAVTMAKAAPKDEAVGLATPDQLATHWAALDLDDAQMPSSHDLEIKARRIEHFMLAEPGVMNSGGASASVTRAGRWLATTNGFSAGYASSLHVMSATAIAGGGTAMERDSWYSAKRHMAELEHADAIGKTAAHRAVKRLNAGRISTRTATVVFEPSAASGFIRHLLSAANGSAVARQSTFLAGKLGELVYPEAITIRDDPTVVRGLSSRPFDGEGLSASALDIVSNGVLSAYLLDLASARRLSMSPNGRAARGGGTPTPSATNVTVSGGSGDMASLMAEAGVGLLVTDLIGMGANVVSGAYSRGAAGYWFENGQIVHPVAEVTIAGDMADMFRRARFADDAPGRYSVDAPAVALEGMTIGGS